MVYGEKIRQERVEQFLTAVAQSPKSALLLDYDGTLAPFRIERERALPYAGVTQLLQQIVDTGRTRLAIITGREAHEIGPLLGLDPVPEVWGAHGLQRLWPDGVCEMPEIPRAMAQGLEDAHRWLHYQGLQHLAEIKPGSIAVHWRSLDQTSALKLRGRILLGWFSIADRGGLKLLEFDGGVEMRLPHVDKGDAVRTLVQELGSDVPIAYLGDDATDEHAFQALGQDGLTVLVRPALRRTSAQVWLEGPEELMDFLTSWLEATQTKQSRSASNSH